MRSLRECQRVDPKLRRHRCPLGGSAHGSLAPQRRRRCGRDQGAEEIGQEASKARKRSEGDAHADRRQEADEGDHREEAGGTTAAQVRLTRPEPLLMRGFAKRRLQTQISVLVARFSQSASSRSPQEPSEPIECTVTAYPVMLSS